MEYNRCIPRVDTTLVHVWKASRDFPGVEPKFIFSLFENRFRFGEGSVFSPPQLSKRKHFNRMTESRDFLFFSSGTSQQRNGSSFTGYLPFQLESLLRENPGGGERFGGVRFSGAAENAASPGTASSGVHKKQFRSLRRRRKHN